MSALGDSPRPCSLSQLTSAVGSKRPMKAKVEAIQWTITSMIMKNFTLRCHTPAACAVMVWKGTSNSKRGAAFTHGHGRTCSRKKRQWRVAGRPCDPLIPLYLPTSGLVPPHVQADDPKLDTLSDRPLPALEEP